MERKYQKICEICGEEFFGWRQSQRFCSYRCAAKWHSKTLRGKNAPGYGKPPSRGMFGKHHTKKAKEKISKAKTGEKNAMYGKLRSEETLKKIIRAKNIQPTKSEIRLNSILQQVLPNEYALNVKAEIMTLGGKIPDFVNVNGQKKIIELFGSYWHIGKKVKYIATEEGRRDYFKKLGWNTLVIWGKELENLEQLKQKILEFNET